jgi:hypothetical protein
MTIRGVDVVLRVERPVPVADMILRVTRRHWPGCVFQDADQAQTFDNNDPSLWLYGTASREFFIYRDREAAKAWRQFGGTPENQNTMLHFLIGGDSTGEPPRRDVTVVVGELSGEMVSLVDDLKYAVGSISSFRR